MEYSLYFSAQNSQNMNKFFLSILSLTFIVLCLNSCAEKQDPLEVMKAEVMKIHDDAMAEIGTLRKATFMLDEKAQTSADSLEIRKVITMLSEADDAMMDWMAAYKEPKEGLEKFFAVQKIEISKVAEMMKESLEASKKYTNE